MSERGGILSVDTDSGSHDRANDSPDVSKDAKIGRAGRVKSPAPTFRFSISQTGVRIEYTFDPYVSFEPMKLCSACDRETPFVFHVSKFLAYRKCFEHMKPNEKELVKEFYGVISTSIRRDTTE